MRWFLVIIFVFLATMSLFGTFSDKERLEDKKSYKELSAVLGALAILTAAIIK